MINLLSLNKILVFLVTIISFWLGFWVYLSNRKRKLNQIFLALVIFTSLWVILYYLVTLSSHVPRAELLARWGYGAVSLFYIPFYLFFVCLLNLEEKFRVLTKVVSVSAVGLFLLSVFSESVVKGVELKEWGAIISIGKGALAFYFMAISLSVLVLVLLWKKYVVSSKQERLRIQYLLIGAIIWILTNFVFNMASPLVQGETKYAIFGNYSIIFLLGFTAAAIVKRKLFGIKVILTQLLVGVIAILLLVNFFVSESMFEFIWKGVLFAMFLVFGWLLVRSVKREIEQRERLNKLATELAVTNVRLQGAYRQVQKLDKAKTEFLSIASHQLRTPLTAIKGYTSMLLEGDFGKLSKKAGEKMKNVLQAAERLIKLINSLLNISRIETGKTKFEPAELSIDELIAEIVQGFEMRTEPKGLYLKFEKPEEKLPNIMADEEKLREVISNLLDNAIKYTQKGGITVKLTRQSSKLLRVSVSDTGEGMDKEEMDKLFQSFSRAGAGRRRWIQGSGLGLYVARKFTEMHKGRIWVESKGKGQGSSFIIELPFKN